jgi:exonuclease III
MISILSWNIRQGGGSRVASILAALLAESADMLVLSEFRNNDRGLELRTKLLQRGYSFQVVTPADPDVNSVLVASRYACGSALFPKSDKNYPHALVRADLELFSLYGVYFPHKKKHKLFDFLESELDDEIPSIIAGDWNTGKNGLDQRGNSFWYSDHLTVLESRGYFDAFRRLHGDVAEYSWFSHQGNGYRYDHTFVHESLAPLVKECYYLHGWREEKWSDHSAMMLKLGE